ncbi:MAG TPA: hypothetical protein VK362_00960 [Reyranella sp.]|nr:hypothetical protein [Reyranella sp.]
MVGLTPGGDAISRSARQESRAPQDPFPHLGRLRRGVESAGFARARDISNAMAPSYRRGGDGGPGLAKRLLTDVREDPGWLERAARSSGSGRTWDPYERPIGSPMVQKQKTEHAFMVNLSRLAIGMDPLSKHIDDSDALSLDHEAMTGAMRVRAASKNLSSGTRDHKGFDTGLAFL